MSGISGETGASSTSGPPLSTGASTSYPAIPMTRWDVYRDRDGKPVTITPEQCAAIRHALQVYSEVVEAGGAGVFDSQTALGIAHFMNAKSALMGRMLYEGRPPLDLPPPTTHMAAPAWHLYDADLCPDCFGLRAAPARVVEVGLTPIEGGYQRHERFCARDWHPSASDGYAADAGNLSTDASDDSPALGGTE